jgi:NADH-quinone oxidoreductase subunit N
VPFHFYAPDVYQGAPTSGGALLAFVPKVAGFVALIRILGLAAAGPTGAGFALGTQVPLLLWILAAITMTVGNVLALLQDDLKRILAYSSVAHAGYMLIGLTVAPNLMPRGAEGEIVPGGVESVLFYLVSYGAMTLGAFGVIALLSTHSRPVNTVDDLAGLGRSDPGVALMMALFLFSLIGLPMTAGFVGKFLLFFGAMAAPGRLIDESQGGLFRLLALIGALNAAVGAYYYLRIVAVMFLRDGVKPLATPRRLAGLTTLWLCAGLTIWLGVYPWPLLRMTRAACAPPAPVQASR